MNRVFRYRLYPTAKQSDTLRLMLEDHCSLYNAALQERRDAYRHPSKTLIKYRDQSVQLKTIRQFDPNQKRWSFASQQQTLRRLDVAFQAFFRRIRSGAEPGYPRFRSKHRFDTVTFVNGDGGAFIPETNRVRIQGVGHVKVKLHRPVRGIVKQFSVTRTGRHWYLNLICVDVPQQVRPLTGAVVGIDRGVTHLLADSDGKLHQNPRYGKQSQDDLAKAQRELAGKKRGSNNRRRSVERVAKLHRHIRNQRVNRLHEISRELVNTYDLIVLEDLKIRNMTRSASGTIEEPGVNVAQKSGLNRAILDSGWGVLHGLIGYKAEEAGIEVMTVNPRNTSRTCYECKFVDAGNRNGEMFKCLRCGHTDHADINAAKNILRLGLSRRTATAA
jgi:putative transposase